MPVACNPVLVRTQTRYLFGSGVSRIRRESSRDLYSPLIKPVQVTFQTSLAHGLRSFRMRLVWGLRL